MAFICIRSADSVTSVKNIFIYNGWKSSSGYTLWTEEVNIKNVFPFFPISGPTGSGKPDASILGESLGQEESNDTSIVPIGPAVSPARTRHYSYFNQIQRIIYETVQI